MNKATQHLMAHNIKPSLQRIAIMKFLLEHPVHPSVDKIYSALSDEIPTLSRTTVYNTLRILEENDALVTLNIDSNSVRYDGNILPHAHFICRVCGNIHDTQLPPSLLDKIPGMEDFKVEAIKLYYKGVCDKCQQSDKKEII